MIGAPAKENKMKPQFFRIKNTLFRILLGSVILSIFVVCGCTTPVGVNRVSEKNAYNQIDESALTSNSYSSYTAVVLHRYALQENEFDEDPAMFIRKLHNIACRDDRRDILLCLSELCFLVAKRAEFENEKPVFDNRERFYYPIEPDVIGPLHEPINPRDYFLGSAVYAYLFLLGPGSEPPPGSFDRRFRLACDLYNRSLANFSTFVNGRIELEENVLPLPAGSIRLAIKTIHMPWDTKELSTVLPADFFSVHGLSVRNRISGLGAPVLAVRKKSPGMPVSSAVPATVFLEINGGIEDMAAGSCAGEISVYSSMSENEIIINGKKVPLETDLTAPIAYSLNDPVLWSLGWNLFRMGRSLFNPGIYPVQPYQKGLVPLVLVHGTMSSPAWWAEMLNTLRSDPQVRQHFQIWLYLYDSGKPVTFSAIGLRESIEKRIRQCDPNGLDPALKNIVVIGHSQGGLLSRIITVETGDSLIKAIIGKSLDELKPSLSPEDLRLVNRYAVYHPMPEISRVVFICTPHRGSILADNLARRVAAYFISLPNEFIQTGNALLHIAERFSIAGKLKWDIARTSIDSMAPDNPSLLAMANLPISPGIKAHSIIAIKGNEKPPDGDDGVVAYQSAHLDGVESELVVPYGHSCQMEPEVIEEVRRILIEHIHDMEQIKGGQAS